MMVRLYLIIVTVTRHLLEPISKRRLRCPWLCFPEQTGLHTYFHEDQRVHQTDSKCSNTNPPGADSTLESVCALPAEHIYFLKGDVKSRLKRGTLIHLFEMDSLNRV